MRCSIALCNSDNQSKNFAKETMFFRFPTNPEMLKIWVDACKRKDNFIPSNGRVCSKHFSEDSYVRDLQFELTGYASKNHRLLKGDAVPTLNLPCSKQPLISKRQKGIETRKRKKLDSDLLTSASVSTSVQVLEDKKSSEIQMVKIEHVDIEEQYTDENRVHNREALFEKIDVPSFIKVEVRENGEYNPIDIERKNIDSQLIEADVCNSTSHLKSLLSKCMDSVHKCHLCEFSPNHKCDHSIEKTDLISKFKNFSRLSIDEKLEIKRNGRPTPNLDFEVSSTSRGKNYTRKFNKNIYEKYGWICGCEMKNRLYCFVCVLFGGEKHWTVNGIDDLAHLAEKAKSHGISKQHLTNQMHMTLLGKANIQEQLDTAYWNNIAIHNEKVAKNRFLLSKIIEAIKFCGTFESGNSEHPGIFQGLINYTAEIDKTLKDHLDRAKVFKGTSKEIQNDLLDCIFEVYREVISVEIQSADFLGVMAEETADVSSKLQTVLIFRYVKDGKPVERFWGFFKSEQQTAEALSCLILGELEPLVAENPHKLIAQSYDGTAVISGKPSGVQARIKEKYPLAHFVHCYDHQLNLIMSQAASRNNDVRLFFGNLNEIPTFFSNSSQRVSFLDRVLKRKIPRSFPTRWNFESRTVNLVFENKEQLMECMEEIEESSGVNMATKTQAGAIRRLLQEKSFIFWLTFFHYVMLQVDIFFSELQKRIFDSVEISKSLKKFKESIGNIRNNKIYDILNEARAVQVIETKRRKLNEDTWRLSAIEVCDIIINVAEDRFAYTNQLNAANLFLCEKFEWYDFTFPQEYFMKTIESYPILEKTRLKTELSVLYSSSEYRSFSSCAVLLSFLFDNNLQEVFKETIKLLQILVTMPMTTVEAEKSFSSFKRIKMFLRSTTSQDRLNALACLSIEQKLIRSLPEFNEKVIDKFAMKKDICIDLVFKKN